jgi:hypothetical protein
MYRIISGRSSGKTHQLMEFAKENNASIACSNPKAMAQKAYAYGIIGVNFISYSDLFTTSYEGNVVIDELETFVHNYIDANIIGYTLTNED